MPLNPGREEAQTLRASVFTLSRPLARSLFSAPLSPILCPVPRLSKPLPGAERSPVQVHSHFSCPIQLHEAESIQVKTSVHCPTLDSASRSLTATPLFWGKTPPPHPTTLLFSLTHSRERDCIFFFFLLGTLKTTVFVFFFFAPLPLPQLCKGMRNSPLSKTVPAVNESSESCSALQAYKAFAFRNGVLCENRSLFSSIFKPSESPRYVISLIHFPASHLVVSCGNSLTRQPDGKT